MWLLIHNGWRRVFRKHKWVSRAERVWTYNSTSNITKFKSHSNHDNSLLENVFQPEHSGLKITLILNRVFVTCYKIWVNDVNHLLVEIIRQSIYGVFTICRSSISCSWYDIDFTPWHLEFKDQFVLFFPEPLLSVVIFLTNLWLQNNA